MDWIGYWYVPNMTKNEISETITGWICRVCAEQGTVTKMVQYKLTCKKCGQGHRDEKIDHEGRVKEGGIPIASSMFRKDEEDLRL